MFLRARESMASEYQFVMLSCGADQLAFSKWGSGQRLQLPSDHG